MRKSLIDKGHPQLSVRRQAGLVLVNRNRLPPKASKTSDEELALCRAIDELHLERPYYGSRRMSVELTARGHAISRGRARRLMRKMGLVAVYPKPRTSVRDSKHKVYPYLLRDKQISRANEVWCSDIAYIPMRRGFAYLAVVMDWHSRAVLGWRISNTLDADFCVDALRAARRAAGTWPEIVNTDQGCQYTSQAWTGLLKGESVKISMDGKGRWIDNVMVERLWRSLKYEDIYLKEYLNLVDLEAGVGAWIDFYNHERRHQSLEYTPPWEIFRGEASKVPA